MLCIMGDSISPLIISGSGMPPPPVPAPKPPIPPRPANGDLCEAPVEVLAGWLAAALG
jgi:hypothetical protein